MKRILAALMLALTAISAYAQTTPQNIASSDAPYGYVELVGPTTYHIVGRDSLYDLTPNQWRVLQAANSKLSESWRVGITATGLYRVHLTVNEPITIPAGMTVRVRLERPANFVDNPVTGGRPFVNGGVNSDAPDAVRQQMREQALRDFNRNNPGSTLRPDDFSIVGNIERGRLHGPGIVYFADRPNEGRPTMYNGELGYRATVRNRLTGQQSQQMFLQGCANDARRGNFLRAGGEGFQFIPEGIIPGSDPTPTPDKSLLLLIYWAVGLGVLAFLVFWALPRSGWNLPFLGRFNPAPVVPVAAGALLPGEPSVTAEAVEKPVASTTEAVEEPLAPAASLAPVIALAAARAEPEMTTLVLDGTAYHVPTAATVRIGNGRVIIEGADFFIEIVPEKRAQSSQATREISR